MDVLKTLKFEGYLGTLRIYNTGGGTYDPSTGRAAPKGPTDSIRTCLVLDQLTKTPSRTYGHAGRDQEVNTLVEGAQKWALMDAIGPAPKVQDHLLVADLEYYILNVQVIADRDGPALYILALKI